MHSDLGGDESEDAGAENGDDDCENNFFDEESSDEETIAEPVQFKDSPIAVPMNYVSGEHGQGKLIKTYSPESLHSMVKQARVSLSSASETTTKGKRREAWAKNQGVSLWTRPGGTHWWRWPRSILPVLEVQTMHATVLFQSTQPPWKEAI